MKTGCTDVSHVNKELKKEEKDQATSIKGPGLQLGTGH